MNGVLNRLLVGQERIATVRNRCKGAKLGLTKGVKTLKFTDLLGRERKD